MMLSNRQACIGEIEKRLIERAVADPFEDALFAFGSVENVDDLAELPKLIEPPVFKKIGKSVRTLAEFQQTVVFLLEIQPTGIKPVGGFLRDFADLLADIGLDGLAHLCSDNILGFVGLHPVRNDGKDPGTCVIDVLCDQRESDKTRNRRDEPAGDDAGDACPK